MKSRRNVSDQSLIRMKAVAELYKTEKVKRMSYMCYDKLG